MRWRRGRLAATRHSAGPIGSDRELSLVLHRVQHLSDLLRNGILFPGLFSLSAVVYCSIFYWGHRASPNLPDLLKGCLLISVVSSLCILFVWPDSVMQSNYRGLLPFVTIRYWGLTAHANTFGSICATLLLLEIATPSSYRLRRSLILLCATISLLLTQSKTSIGAAAIALVVIGLWRLELRRKSFFAAATFATVGIAAVMLATIVIAVGPTVGAAIFGRETAMHLTQVGAEMSTATGRSSIWNAALRGGLESFQFGYGASFWTLEKRLSLGLTGATDAHNLYLQVFSRAGLFGLTSLLVFIFFFARSCVSSASTTRGGTIGLLVFVVIRSQFEVAIQPSAMLAGDLIALLAILLYVQHSDVRD